MIDKERPNKNTNLTFCLEGSLFIFTNGVCNHGKPRSEHPVIYIINSLVCLSVCLFVCSMLSPKRLGRFQNFFACELPLGQGWF